MFRSGGQHAFRLVLALRGLQGKRSRSGGRSQGLRVWGLGLWGLGFRV